MANIDFFKNNVAFYSEEYRDYSLKPWEKSIVDMVTGDNVLDVACGGGRITVPLLRRGHNVIGTDFVKEFEPMIRRHESEFKGKFEFVESGMAELPFKDNTFDAVTCINSIIYLGNITEVSGAITEMSRVLKPQGKLFITTWNILHPLWGTSVVLNYLLRRAKTFGETSPFWATDGRLENSPTHMFVPTKRTLMKVCKDAGLSVHICTGSQFGERIKPLSAFHPILVITGVKSGR